MATLQVNGQTIIVDESNLPYATKLTKGAVNQGDSVAKKPWIATQQLSEPEYAGNKIISSLRESKTIANDKFIIVYNMNLSDYDYEDNRYDNTITVNEVYSSGDSVSVLFSGLYGTPFRDGYDFLGWSYNPNAVYPDYDVSHSGGYTLTFTSDDIILYAVWSEITYNVTYHLGDLGQGSVPAPQTAQEGVELMLEFSPYPTVNDGSGRVFVGWSTADHTSTPQYSENGGVNYVSLYGNLDLYPVFAYVVTYNLGEYGQGQIPLPEIGQYGDTVFLDFYPQPSPSFGSEVFCGWATTDGLTHYNLANYTEDGVNFITISQNIDLYPVFSMRYRLIYSNSNDSTGDVPSLKYGFEDQTISVSFSPYPTCISDPSKAFIGWSTVEGDTTPEYTDGGVNTISLNNDVILYPVFQSSQPQYDAQVYFDFSGLGGNDELEVEYYHDGMWDTYQSVYGSGTVYFTAGESYRISVSGITSTLSSVFYTGTYGNKSQADQDITNTPYLYNPDKDNTTYIFTTGNSGTIRFVTK